MRAKLVLAGKPYSVNRRGSRPGSVPTLAKAIARVRRAAQKQSNAGEAYIIRGSAGVGYMLRIIEVTPKVPAPSSATPPIQEVYSYVFAKYPDAQNWGICNCRPIAGTTVWSNHAWCNALDIGGPTKLLDQIARDLNNNRKLPISELLWRVANHYDHIHVTGSPKKSGRPPCAK